MAAKIVLQNVYKKMAHYQKFGIAKVGLRSFLKSKWIFGTHIRFENIIETSLLPLAPSS